MHLVATLCRDEHLANALRRYRDPQGRFHLHPLEPRLGLQGLPHLATLSFAGALVLDPDAQATARDLATRTSLEADEVGRVDALAVSPAGLIGEFNLGRAVRAVLTQAGWDGRGAGALILGGGPSAAAIAREISSLGAARITVLADSLPAAEQALPRVAASTEVEARTTSDPALEALLDRADLLVRVDPEERVPLAGLGPHLTVLDLAPRAVTPLRQQALNVGALSFNLRDVQAHVVALGLSQVLGGAIEPGPLLDLLHA